MTWAILTRFAVLFRAAGWLIALSIGFAFDFLRQVVNAVRPAVADFADAPPWITILLGLESLIPGPVGSLVALGLGLLLRRFGAKILTPQG